jgi:hypothetical protein
MDAFARALSANKFVCASIQRWAAAPASLARITIAMSFGLGLMAGQRVQVARILASQRTANTEDISNKQ